MTSAVALIAASVTIAAPACADEAPRQKWIDSEFQPSTLSKDDQMKEMQWFIKAAAALQGHGDQRRLGNARRRTSMNRRRWPRPSTEITGIKVKHDIIQEGDVVEKMQTQMQSGKNVYDGWINDSDLIGTHFRYGQTVDPDRLHGRRRQGRHRPDARRQRLHRQVLHHGAGRQALSACPTSSSRTSTGSATTGSPIPTTRPSSRPSMATISACP